jgi:GT2 family glycosyltransferase
VPVPRIRAVVVNYNGGSLVERCVRSLLASEWPADRLEVVVVDNASSDGSPDRLATAFPSVRLIRSPHNLGFAAGNNAALSDLDGVDYIALVNPDATVEPGWLTPLVEALAADPRAGAANPKVLLDPRFTPLRLTCDPFVPGGADERRLGVAVHDVRGGAEPGWDATVFGEGFHDEEWAAGSSFRWAGPEAELWLPAAPADRPDAAAHVEFLAAAEREKPLRVVTTTTTLEVAVGPEPRWIALAVDPPYVDLLNDAGSVLVDGAFPANRGLGTPDDGTFDTPDEVFAFTATVAMLRAAFLRDIGLFDETLFMYYEDFDLSWRGRLRGWHYLYVPGSRARHVRGAIAGHRSALADRLVHRNGLVTLAKNAPGPIARREARRYVRDTLRIARVEVAAPLGRGRRPRPTLTGRRLRALAGFVSRLPGALRARAILGRRAVVDRDAVAAWEPPPSRAPSPSG